MKCQLSTFTWYPIDPLDVAIALAGLRPFSGAPAAVQLHVPKIPTRWLAAVLEHARRCGQGGVVARPIEQMYHFHHLNGDGWQVSVPAQKASAGRVSYWGGNVASVVLDLHSHHEMGAFFSSTDNGDELGCRLYAVIGCIYSRPELRLRLGLYGSFAEVDLLAVFEGLGPFEGVSRRSPGEGMAEAR